MENVQITVINEQGVPVDVNPTSIAKMIKNKDGRNQQEINDNVDVNQQEIKQLHAIIESKVYGVEIDYNNQTITRIGDSIGLSAGTDFDNIYPWNLMKREIVDGQTMVPINNFYYSRKIINSSPNPNGSFGRLVNKEIIAISPKQLSGFKPFLNYADGIKPVCYFSSFEGSESGGKLCSTPNSVVLANKTREAFRKLAQARGAGWQQQDFILSSAIQMLYLIEYASFDMQTGLGLGVTGATSKVDTGQTVLLGDKSGMATGENGKVSVSYRGVENFHGNVWKLVDGVNVECNGLQTFYITNDTKKYLDNTKDGFFGVSAAKNDGYVDKIAISDNLDFGFVTATTTGASNKPLNDYYYQNNTANGYAIARLGGGWADGLNAGGFYWVLSNAASYSASFIGGRLVCIPV